MRTIEELQRDFDCKKIFQHVMRVADGCNVSLDDAFNHVCTLCDAEIHPEEVELIWTHGGHNESNL